jgi:gentisate 1,2-dioxygenase
MSSQVAAIVTEGLAEAVQRANMQPLWDRYRSLNTREPQPIDPPFLWPWSQTAPLIDRAAREVAIGDAERRVLMMTNPAFGGEAATTTNLIGGVQVLEPGDRAPAHRHSASAIRLVMQAEGGTTFVDGKACEMREGDFILTPAWTWHWHVNDSKNRIIWFDGLDVPLARRSLDVMFFEPHPPEGAIAAAMSPVAPWRWAESGLASAEMPAEAPAHSPQFHYPWQATLATLDALPQRPDGAKVLRYVNPQTGGAVMPTIDCGVFRLEGNAETVAYRTTCNAICVVVDGEGRSSVGDKTFNWRKHDVFTVPHWTWASHRAAGSRAHLFFFTDRELYRRLSLLRDEVAQ